MDYRNFSTDPKSPWCKRCGGNTLFQTVATYNISKDGNEFHTGHEYHCKICGNVKMFIPDHYRNSLKKAYAWTGVCFFPAGALIFVHYLSEERFEDLYIKLAGVFILIGLVVLAANVLGYFRWLSWKKSEGAKKLLPVLDDN